MSRKNTFKVLQIALAKLQYDPERNEFSGYLTPSETRQLLKLGYKLQPSSYYFWPVDPDKNNPRWLYFEGPSKGLDSKEYQKQLYENRY